MRAIVTGASGFVGRELCRHLIAEGDELLPFGTDGPEAIDILDRPAVMEAIVSSEVEAVYHLAGFSHVGASFERPVEAIRVNVEGTLNVLDASRAAGAQRVLVVGSADQYGKAGPNDQPRTEEAPLRPLSPYAVSKVAAEYLGLQAHGSWGLGTIMTRSFNHTGPGQSQEFVVPALAGRIARAEIEGSEEIQCGSLDAVREVNDVRDIVRAYRLLVSHATPGFIYNVCSGVAFTIGEVADRLLGLARRPLRLRQDPSLLRSVEADRLVGDPTKLKACTGWQPQHTLEQTLVGVLDEARRQVK